MSWADGENLSPDERAVWEDKVRVALYSEQARERADVERKHRFECAVDESAGLDDEAA